MTAPGNMRLPPAHLRINSEIPCYLRVLPDKKPAEIKPQQTALRSGSPVADKARYQLPADDGPDKSVKCLTQQPWRSFWGHPRKQAESGTRKKKIYQLVGLPELMFCSYSLKRKHRNFAVSLFLLHDYHWVHLLIVLSKI